MRILLVIDSLSSGGAQRQITTLATGLARKGHEVWLYHYFPKLDYFRGALLDAGVTIIDGTKNGRYSLQPVSDIKRTRRTAAIEIIISFLTTPNIYTLLASLSRDRVPVIVSERSQDQATGNWLINRLQSWLYGKASLLTVNSKHQLTRLKNRWPRLGTPISVVYNGIDLDHFKPPTQSCRHNPASLTLLSIATLHRLKNARRLIEAVAACKQKGLLLNIDWLGRLDGGKDIEDEFRFCSDLIDRHGLAGQWHWLGVQQDVVRRIGAADAIIHPSMSEGLPNAICEALACGKIVLAGDVGDHRELLGDNERGFLFDPQSVTNIVAAILRFAELTEVQRAEMQSACRQYAEAVLSVERYVSAYETLARSLVATGSAP